MGNTTRKCKLKTGDNVLVLTGRDKGRTGVITKIYLQSRKFKQDRVVALVEGINLIKKHVRPNPNTGDEGGIIEREAAIDISNLAIVNTATNKADRIGYKTLEDGKKVRVTRSDNEVIDG